MMSSSQRKKLSFHTPITTVCVPRSYTDAITSACASFSDVGGKAPSLWISMEGTFAKNKRDKHFSLPSSTFYCLYKGEDEEIYFADFMKLLNCCVISTCKMKQLSETTVCSTVSLFYCVAGKEYFATYWIWWNVPPLPFCLCISLLFFFFGGGEGEEILESPSLILQTVVITLKFLYSSLQQRDTCLLHCSCFSFSNFWGQKLINRTDVIWRHWWYVLRGDTCRVLRKQCKYMHQSAL